MKIGIRCEIHECTIEVCKILEQERIVPSGSAAMLEADKELRIDNQYYLKNKDANVDYDVLLEFVWGMKDRINKMTLEEIKKIRRKIKRYS